MCPRTVITTPTPSTPWYPPPQRTVAPSGCSCMLHIAHCTLHIARCTLHVAYCILQATYVCCKAQVFICDSFFVRVLGVQKNVFIFTQRMLTDMAKWWTKCGFGGKTSGFARGEIREWDEGILSAIFLSPHNLLSWAFPYTFSCYFLWFSYVLSFSLEFSTF